MNFVRYANEPEPTERLAQIERRLEIVEGIFRTASGFDPNLSEDTEMLRALIAEFPGMSQTSIARLAGQRFEMSRNRAIEVLRAQVGKIWRVEFGLCNALMYFLLASGSHTEPKATDASMIACEANQV